MSSLLYHQQTALASLSNTRADIQSLSEEFYLPHAGRPLSRLTYLPFIS